MMELKVILDFACCTCGHSVSVTVKCEGQGLAQGMRSVAAVHIPCPTCGHGNHLFFEPNGTIRDVVPVRAPRAWPEPSVN